MWQGVARVVSKFFDRAGNRAIRLGKRLRPPEPPPHAPEPTPKELAIRNWLAADGDKTLRLEYALNSRSVVLDVGGYEGQWASDIFSRYLCQIHIFEPIPAFADAIAHRFAANSAIKLHRMALGAAAGAANMFVSGEGSSLHLGTGDGVLVRVTTLEEVMAAEGISEIALMKLNIEGAEYDLLEYLITNDLVRRIGSLQIQFHDFIDNAATRRQAIQSGLAKTHKLKYEYPFIWESWERRSSHGG